MITFTLSHIVGLGLSIILLYKGYRLAREQREEVLEFVVWTAFGGAVGILTVVSSVSGVGVVELADVSFWATDAAPGVGIGIVFLFGLLIFAVVYTQLQVKQLHEELVDIQRELAFLRYETGRHRDTSVDAVERTSEEEYEDFGGEKPAASTSSESTVGVPEE